MAGVAGATNLPHYLQLCVVVTDGLAIMIPNVVAECPIAMLTQAGDYMNGVCGGTGGDLRIARRLITVPGRMPVYY